ncbi:MAG: hypothetical protein GY855_13455, partial [candidate division Zixibacteria bacterium]|nr:hypothetical protein [candidate division Zixibacteria bacterium]
GGGVVADTIEIRVSHNDDDAEEDDGGGMTVDNDKIEMGQMKYVGLRFLNVTIPPGATITAAYIEFKAADGNTEDTDIRIWGEDVNDASRFDDGDDDISDRQKTSSSVTWNNVENWSSGQTYQTPDISSVIQEIVDKGGWLSGYDMVIMLESTDLNGKRYITAHDDSPSNASLLHVEYE